jgi:nucleoside diphosphate kinase
MSRLGTILIKPDAIQDGLLSDIIADIVSNGFQLLTTKEVYILPDQIPILCSPEELAERRITAFGLIQNYLSGESIIAIIKGNINGTSEMLEIKGKVTSSGLRYKYFSYHGINLEELEKSDPVQFGLMKGRNRVHSPDTESEAYNIISTFFTPEELEELGIRNEVEELSLETKELTFK